jgi:PAS domain S-box-containing protein
MILVVDDEPEARTLLTAILTAEGYHVRAVDSGELALVAVNLNRPDLLLVDVRMPGMDGFEICRRLKGATGARDIPVMFISASNELAEKLEGFRLGAVDFISKPFQREELLARVRTHLELGGLRAHLEEQVAERTAQLRESTQRFGNVFEEGPLGIALVGANHRFLEVNRSFREMVGYSESELLQMSFADITHPDDVHSDLALAARLFKREIPFYRIQKRYLKKTGEMIWANLTASAIIGPEGELSHGMKMVEDITEAKRAHDEAIARQKLESVGTLASGIAHDFNNLLGGIMADAELGATEVAAGSSAFESIHRIRTAAQRGAEIVRELMIFSGQENEGPMEPVDLPLLVEEMLELLKVSISKRVVLKTDLHRELPAVLGRASQLRQVVMNLIINASEATEGEGGAIRVAVSCTIPGNQVPDRGLQSASGNYVKLEVSDTGAGIPKEVQAKIFDPFFSTKFAGRGMGLAVIQTIVKNHAGAINLVSAPGRGTTFEIFLPCAGEMTESSPSPGSVAPFRTQPRSSSGTVLAVEDESALRLPVAKMLRKNGFCVIEAIDGSSALEELRTHQEINVMLLDVSLPGMPCREVLENAHHRHPNVKVIITSAYSREIVESGFVGAQIERFIRKPFRFGDLLAILEDALSA